MINRKAYSGMNKIVKKVAEINDNCDLNSCLMEDKLMKAVDSIKSSNRWFSVMNDRSQGGTALKPGTIELM